MFKEENEAYRARLNESLSKVNDLSVAKKRLTYSRWKVSENLDKLLFEFETNVKKNDAQVNWCPDVKSGLEQLNKQLKNFNRVEFFQHNSVKHFVNALDIKIPETSKDPEALVIGAKFIMANTGNFFVALESEEQYEKILKARKVVVIAGIDSVISQQTELYTARQMYSIFETGNLHYPVEFMARPGRVRGMNLEISILLVDINKSRLLDLPYHRPLFSLLNFDLPPVCPMEQFNYSESDWKYQDTLTIFLSAFMNGVKSNSDKINGNYGLRILNDFIPYDLDMYDQVMESRALLHSDDKKTGLLSFLDQDKSAIAMNPKKFKDAEKFKKYSEHNFFGRF
ncbi:MAG: hypothetical protein IT245_02245 [Bacteroidia bacterium]|nr:hypothetical protein [Bacteroidia bacterium]